jgi:hypothetical protein
VGSVVSLLLVCTYRSFPSVGLATASSQQLIPSTTLRCLTTIALQPSPPPRLQIGDIQQPCWQGWHRAWALGLGLPLLLIFCVAMPAAVAGVLWAHRAALATPHVRHRLGHLYMPWRPACYWYHALIMAQIVALSCISVFRHSIGALYASQMFAGAVMVMLVLHICLRPQQAAALNELFAVQLLVLLLVAWAALALQASALQEGATLSVPPKAVAEVLGAIAVVLAGGFILLCIGLFIKLAREKVKQAAQKVGKQWVLDVAGNLSSAPLKF